MWGSFILGLNSFLNSTYFSQMAVGYDSDAEGATSTNGVGFGGSFGEKLVS